MLDSPPILTGPQRFGAQTSTAPGRYLRAD
jgi:hypothetical protein